MHLEMVPIIRGEMFGILAYAIVGLVVAGVIQLFRGLITRYNHGEGGGPLQLVLTWIVVMAIPYVWVEAQTSMHSNEFEPIIEEVAKRELVDGNVAYFKVLYARNDDAKLVVVCNGDYEWGGTYRNIYDLRLSKQGTTWMLDMVDPVNTSDGDSAGFTVPPYW